MNAEIRMGIVILLRKKRKRHYCGSLAEMEREKDEGGEKIEGIKELIGNNTSIYVCMYE